MVATIKSNTARLKAKMSFDNQYRLRRIIEDVHMNANEKTPMKYGPLRAAVLKTVESGNKGVIEWREPYAQIQEKGGHGDPDDLINFRPFMNYTTPGTGPHFAENAVEKAVKEAYVYFGDWL